MGAYRESGQRHGVVLVSPARGDGDELWTLFLEHERVIRVLAEGAAGGGGFGAADSVGVGDRNELDVGASAENLIESVAIIAAAGVADDGGLPNCRSRRRFRGSQSFGGQCGGRGEDSTLEEMATIHEDRSL